MDNAIGVDEAYEYMLSKPDMIDKYEFECLKYDWEEKKLCKNSQWANWFARVMLVDRWPSAEPLIKLNPIIYKGYQDYICMMDKIGMTNNSIGQHRMKKDRDDLCRKAFSLPSVLCNSDHHKVVNC